MMRVCRSQKVRHPSVLFATQSAKRPVLSRTLNNSEMQYSSVEKEPTAIKAIRKRPHFLVPVLP